MRFQFLLFPVAVIAVQPALAESFLTIEQSQTLLFPGATFTKNFVRMTEEEYLAIEEKSQVKFWNHDIKAWKVSTGGWYLLDRVSGREDSYITYALAVDPEGTIVGVEILELTSPHYNIANRAWLNQFRGKRHDSLTLASDIKMVSGSSLSSKAVQDGIKRLVSTYEIVLAK